MFINELAEAKVLVIFGGRFQPFHQGHAWAYNYLVGKFGRQNVYVATTGKIEPPKTPFTLSERVYFMNLQGIPSDRIIQISQNYSTEAIQQAFNISNEAQSQYKVLFAVSQKDMDQDPRFSKFTKKDGSLSKLQPMPDDLSQVQTMDQHAYILTYPTKEFTVLGKVCTGASDIRDLYEPADEKTRQKIIADVFGKYTREAEQIFNSRLLPAQAVTPAPLNKKTGLQKVKVPKEEPVNEAGGTGVVANKKQANDPRYSMSLTKDVRPGQINKSLRAFSLAEQGAVDRLAQHEIEHLNKLIDEVMHRITTEKLPPQYVQALKQKIEKLKAERTNIALGRS